MTNQTLENNYWAHYIMLEKEFMATSLFVRIDQANFHTFSDAYTKLLLQIGSEVDVVAKEVCKQVSSTFHGDTMKQYQTVLTGDSDFGNVRIVLIKQGFYLEPWNNKETVQQCQDSLIWWKAYNKVKHERMSVVTIDGIAKESYKFANLINVINALGALYHLLLHSYYLARKQEGEELTIPLPGSRLFALEGGIWRNIVFSFDNSFSIENEHLILRTASFPY